MRMKTTTRRPMARMLGAALAAVAAAALVAGCSSSNSDSQPAASSSAAAFAPVTVTHAFGQTVVSQKPTRIVSLSPVFTDALATLGVKPAGYSPNPLTGADYGWEQGNPDLAGAVTLPLGPGGSVPVEKIAALQPDLILGGNLVMSKDVYDQLSKIAPTIPSLHQGGLDSWQDDTKAVGQILGRGADADKVIGAAANSLAQAKQHYPNLAGKTFSVSLFIDPTNIQVISNPDDPANTFFEGLGLVLPDSVKGLSGGTAGMQGKISLERLDLLNTDLLFVGYMVPGAAAQLENQPLFQGLPAVQHGTYQAADADVSSALRLPTALTTDWLLSKFTPAFSKA